MYLSDYELQIAKQRCADLLREVEIANIAHAARLQRVAARPARSRLARLWSFLVVNRLARA